jgi:hypothetical protein
MYNEQSPNCGSKQPSVAQYDQAIGALEKEQSYTEGVIDQLFDKLDRVLAPPKPVLSDGCGVEAPEKWQGQMLDHIDSMKRTQARMSCRLQDILSRLPF